MIIKVDHLGCVNMEYDHYYETNKRRWNELVEIHSRTEEYDLEGFIAGKTSLHQTELDALGDVDGKSLLHLQCHFGLDTLSWARLGAEVTGVDFSENAVELARGLAERLNIEAKFICSNIYKLPQTLTGLYDIVFTSYGVLCWLNDVKEWGKIISHYLKPGGVFLLVESHPLMWVFDDESPELKVRYSYWHSDEPLSWETDGSYADRNAVLTNKKSYEWTHSVGDILNSLINAGLTIQEIGEHPFSHWQIIPAANKMKNGTWRLPRDRLPLLWSVKAVKPDNESAHIRMR